MRVCTAAAIVTGALCLIGLARAEDLTTTDGVTYKNYSIAVVEPDGIRILYEDGGAKVPFKRLSKEIQKKWDYNPDEARKFVEEQRARRVEAALAYTAQLQAEQRMRDAELVCGWMEKEIDVVRAKLQYLESTTVEPLEGIRLKGDAGSRETMKRQDYERTVAEMKARIATMEAEIAPLKEACREDVMAGAPADDVSQALVAARNHRIFVGMPKRWVLLSMGPPAKVETQKTGDVETEILYYGTDDNPTRVQLDEKGKIAAID